MVWSQGAEQHWHWSQESQRQEKERLCRKGISARKNQQRFGPPVYEKSRRHEPSAPYIACQSVHRRQSCGGRASRIGNWVVSEHPPPGIDASCPHYQCVSQVPSSSGSSSHIFHCSVFEAQSSRRNGSCTNIRSINSTGGSKYCQCCCSRATATTAPTAQSTDYGP